MPLFIVRGTPADEDASGTNVFDTPEKAAMDMG